jgi:predicted transcriptional regulator
MKNVTLSADDELIEKARATARALGTTLNAVFREWLVQFTSSEGDTRNLEAMMKNLRHIRAGRHFTREEMNER